MPAGKTYKSVKSKSAAKAKGATKAPKGGLNKVEIKQTRQIADRLINKKAESKYFACSAIKESNGMLRCRTNNNGIGVRGYATCEDKNSQGTRIPYGKDDSNATQYLSELNMNRTESLASGSDHEKSMAVVGSYATPHYAASEFILERDYVNTAGFATDYSTESVAPYFVRILRLEPRASKFSTVDVDPQNDAFVTEQGNATGINLADFGPVQLKMLKANSRKYKVIQDISFTMVPPFIGTNVATGDTDAGPLGETNALVTNMQRSGFMKRLKMKHDIGKKLYFEAGGQNKTNSTSGQKNEFILFHTCHMGINSQSSLTSYNARELVISGKFVSTFKDL